jgi:hypothetical protein
MIKHTCLTVACILSLALTPQHAPAHHGDDGITETSLLMNGDLEVGRVLMRNDDQFIYVKFELTRHFCWLADTHVDVEEAPEDIPQFNGEALPALFFHERKHGFPERKHTFKIPKQLNWRPETELYIAAAAQIKGFSGRYAVCWAGGELIDPEKTESPAGGMVVNYKVR